MKVLACIPIVLTLMATDEDVVGPVLTFDEAVTLAAARTRQSQPEPFADAIAGTVTRIHVVPGQALFARDPIADVADLSTLHVRGNVAPELLRYVKPGQRVEVKVLSVPPRSFADEIEYVVPPQGGESRGASVIVVIPNPDGSLQPNTEALITIRSLR